MGFGERKGSSRQLWHLKCFRRRIIDDVKHNWNNQEPIIIHVLQAPGEIQTIFLFIPIILII